MSRNGEHALQKIIVSYSPSMGNPATRQFLATYLPAFRQKYPAVAIDLRPRHWPETSITGVYRDGSEKVYCIKHLSSMGINVRFHRLLNDANDTNAPFGAQHIHRQRCSVQGPWNPWLWSFEGNRTRHEAPARWDRKLSGEEWRYYIDQYSAQMKHEEASIDTRVARYTEIPAQNTEEVASRWKRYVLPRIQSDVEYNMDHWKRQHTRGRPRPAPVTVAEYQLFSVPDHTALGQDAVDMLRRKEAQRTEEWWQDRKEQLKPPR